MDKDKPADRVESILDRLRAGDEAARVELFPLVYAELRQLAQRRMIRGAPATLQPTALVNEAYLKLCGDKGSSEWADRAHFFRAAAGAMRSVLVDYARRAKAQKRPDASLRVELDPSLLADFERRAFDLIALDAALEALRSTDPQLADLVELHFFSGHTFADCSAILQVSERTVGRWWNAARLFLRRELDEDGTGGQT